MSIQTDTLVKLQMWFPWKQRHTTSKNKSLTKPWTLDTVSDLFIP